MKKLSQILVLVIGLLMLSVFEPSFVFAGSGCACEWSLGVLGGFGALPRQCNIRCSNYGNICLVDGNCADPCAGVSCPPVCMDGNVQNRDCGAGGVCSTTTVQTCAYGCENAQCNPPPVNPNCRMGLWQNDGCCVNCAANKMSQSRSATNEPCNLVDPIHQCVADSACSGSGGGGSAPAPPSGGGSAPQCNNVFQGYRECTGCSVSSEVWMNSCTGYNYQNPEADVACDGCDWCAAEQGSCPPDSITTPQQPPAAPSPQPGCTFGNVLAQVQKDITDAWKNSLTIAAGGSFNAGAFNDGTGQFIPVGQSTTTVTGPNSFSQQFTQSPAVVSNTAAGTYTVTVSATDCTDSVAAVTVNAAPAAQPPASPQASSATKEVAKVLLKYSESNALEGKTGGYTLFCDSYDKTLNYHSYADQGANVGSTLSQEAGNVCVLRFDALSTQKVLFGAPLKQDLSKSDKVLGVLGDKACDSSVKDEGTDFKACNAASKKIWHRKTANDNGIVVYSKDSFTIPTPEPAFLQDVAALLRKLFGLQPSQTTAVFSLVEKAQNLDKIYVSVSGNKRVTGIVDNVDGKQAIVVEYSGFSTNVCSTVNAYFNSLTPASAPCTDLLGGKYAVSADCSVNPQVCNAWLDLTAKLRIQ